MRLILLCLIESFRSGLRVSLWNDGPSVIECLPNSRGSLEAPSKSRPLQSQSFQSGRMIDLATNHKTEKQCKLITHVPAHPRFICRKPWRNVDAAQQADSSLQRTTLTASVLELSGEASVNTACTCRDSISGVNVFALIIDTRRTLNGPPQFGGARGRDPPKTLRTLPAMARCSVGRWSL